MLKVFNISKQVAITAPITLAFISAVAVSGFIVSGKVLAVADRDHGITEEMPSQNKGLEETTTQYEESVKPNTVENVKDQNSEPNISNSNGINSDEDIYRATQQIQQKKDAIDKVNTLLALVTLCLIGIAGLAIYLNRTDYLNVRSILQRSKIF